MATQALTNLSIKNSKTTPTAEGQAAANRIAEFRQNVNNGATATQARKTVRAIENPVTPPVATPTPVITPDSMAPATPMKVAPPVPSTQAEGMMAEFTDATDTYTQNLADQAKALEAPKTNALNDYITQLTSAKGLTGLTNDAYAVKGGVNDITPELNDINDKIRREQLSMRRRTEAINNNGGGLASGAAAEVANVERESFAKQADLSVIQMAVQGRYDSAKEIADRAVSAQLEKQTNDLAILKFNYDENKELFTKAEQRAFESAQTDRENKLAEERQNLADIKQFAISALQAGASTAEVQKAMQSKTMDEAISLVGGYLRPKPVSTGVGTPTIKTINGVDYQWNPATGTWEVPTVGGVPAGQSNTQTDLVTNTITLADELLSDTTPGKSAAIGASLAKLVPYGKESGMQGDRVAFEEKLNTFKASLSLDNLKMLKGPMSDKDLAFIQSVSSSINPNMSEASFNAEVKKVKERLQKAQKVAQPVVFGIPQLAPNETIADRQAENGAMIIITD